MSVERGRGAVVVIPTYNEREALPGIISLVRKAVPEARILIVDDASPDGTGDIADRLAATDKHVDVLHRTAKTGLGDAYLDAFSWALFHGCDVVVEMDADGSHPADRLPALISAVRPGGVDLAIGSRWIPGGSVVNWPWPRRLISRAGNRYARWALGLDVADATAGFRAFRATTLTIIHLEDVASHGYCFQIDLTRRVRDAGLTIGEIPIEFKERELGSSKMSSAIVVEAMSRVTAWGWERFWQRLTRRNPPPQHRALDA